MRAAIAIAVTAPMFLLVACESERRAFVVEGEGAADLYPQAIVAGSQGDIYYWAQGEIGRIALAP